MKLFSIKDILEVYANNKMYTFTILYSSFIFESFIVQIILMKSYLSNVKIPFFLSFALLLVNVTEIQKVNYVKF